MSCRISVITAVYNDEKHIESSVKSILNQTITDFEYLIIDDGSTDSTPKILEELANKDNRIKVIRQNNSGPAAARNHGFMVSSGEYIAIQDSDDISDPTRFKKQLQILDGNPEIGLCGTHAQFFGHVEARVPLPVSHKSILTRMLFGNPIIHSSVMIRRNLIAEHKLSYKAEYAPTEDFELWMQLSKLTKLYNIKDYLVKYRVHAKSLSRTKDELQRSLANKVSYQALEYFLEIIATEEEAEQHKILLDRTVKIQYNDPLMQLWARKLIIQNDKLRAVDMYELKSLIIRKWFSYLFHHQNTKTNKISNLPKLKRCLKLFLLNGLLVLKFDNWVKF